jgi:hypothetical protein
VVFESVTIGANPSGEIVFVVVPLS